MIVPMQEQVNAMMTGVSPDSLFHAEATVAGTSSPNHFVDFNAWKINENLIKIYLCVTIFSDFISRKTASVYPAYYLEDIKNGYFLN